MSNSSQKTVLERLNAGEIVIGDGGYITEMERRGYATAGLWTPEVNVEHPHAVEGLHHEFARAGSDILQAFTFNANDHLDRAQTGDRNEVNESACRIVKKVSAEYNCLWAGGLSATNIYGHGGSKKDVQEYFKEQAKIFVRHDCDFFIVEYFHICEEAEWAVEVLKETGKPVLASLCITSQGDFKGVPTDECAVRLVKAGADVIGVNCKFDPQESLKAVAKMKEGLEKAGLKAHLMFQPLGFHCPDADNKNGYITLPEFPFVVLPLEPRQLTRWDVHKLTRSAYDLGVRYFGGCCGFKAYHIRAISEELEKERDKIPKTDRKNETMENSSLTRRRRQSCLRVLLLIERSSPRCKMQSELFSPSGLVLPAFLHTYHNNWEQAFCNNLRFSVGRALDLLQDYIVNFKTILERLDAGEILIGDGGYITEMERRGYATGGEWTPEVNVEHPHAGLLNREFARAGSDVLQAFTHHGLWISNLYNTGSSRTEGRAEVNESACRIVKKVAAQYNCLWAGGLCPTSIYGQGGSKKDVQEYFKGQAEIFVRHDSDFIIVEYFYSCEEAEWAVEVLKETGKPVMASLCISTQGDLKGVPTDECAVRLVKAGADVIGVNCKFDPPESLKAVAKMKEGLEKAGLKAHLMFQPLGFHCPDADDKEGYITLPEYPFALEPRQLTRWDVHELTRSAYDLGVRYFGGCCGFKAYHIRAISEELEKERGTKAASSAKHKPFKTMPSSTFGQVQKERNEEYWLNLKPASGRPFCPSY
ncbi:betaine--homocysteine S-methyltransferase 1, partial [Paramuricea clavata]